MQELYLNEKKEIKEKNDIYKKFMIQILDRQVEERKCREKKQ